MHKLTQAQLFALMLGGILLLIAVGVIFGPLALLQVFVIGSLIVCVGAAIWGLWLLAGMLTQ